MNERRHQEAIGEKGRTLEAVLSAMSDPLFVLDHKGRILTCNESAAKRFGQQARELAGTSIFDWLGAPASAAEREQLKTRIAEVFLSAKPVCFTEEREYLVCENTICPVIDDGERVTSVVVSIHDKTHEVLARRALQKAEERYRQLMESISDCIGIPGMDGKLLSLNAAAAKDTTEYEQAIREVHEYDERVRRTGRLACLAMFGVSLAQELTQSLSVIRLADHSALAELGAMARPDIIKQDLDLSLTASATMSAIIGRFRSLAKQSTRPRKNRIRIDRVAAWTIRLLAHAAQSARLSFRTEGLETLPEIQMEESELEQVFFTLAENSVQAADGSRDHCLLIAGTLQKSQIVLRFEDDCGGIDPAYVSKVFDPVFTTQPLNQRAGLGLYIVRQIVRHGGGEISVESRHQEGTTFTVTLPTAQSTYTGSTDRSWLSV